MIGKTLGTFQCAALLGKGGMGEVYRAKDQKLGRDVAIKVLPEEFAKDIDRVARFQREAKLLASLNHPNIAAIYGLEESKGTHYLVLELIEGETLADRLKRGAIPPEEALRLVLQIAEALEAAHEKGVIHRDLKPANIKVTPDGKVKILDFGLAKAFAGEPAEVNLSHSPTLSEAATLQGVILGTAAYMSPEQARGKPVDKRTDIWAFGCVLYEMLTGKAAFQGEDVTEILASVVKSGVNLDLLPANIHPRVGEALIRCLQKDQKKRYRDIGDAQYEIEQVFADPTGVFVSPISTEMPVKKLFPRLSWIALAIALTAIIAGVIGWSLKRSKPEQVIHFDYGLPLGQRFTALGQPRLSISNDGTQLAYAANNQLYLKNLNELTAKSIQGTDEDPCAPFFSPNGQWIGYYSLADRQLKKINASGGAPMTICDATDPGGAFWSDEGNILFGQNSGIMRVSENGGNPELLIPTEGAAENLYGPQILPGGEWVLFTITNSTGPNRWDEAQIVAQSLKTDERKLLVSGGSDARYVPTGHLVYALGNVLSAIAFDVDNLEIKGGASPVIEEIQRAFVPAINTGTANYDFSDNGILAFVLANDASQERERLVWINHEGTREPITDIPVYNYNVPEISPDGTKVAIDVDMEGNTDICVWDFVRNKLNRLTFHEGLDVYPLWTPDGKHIVFTSDREGSYDLYWKPADGTGQVEPLARMPNSNGIYASSWSGDGKTLITVERVANDNIGILSMEGDHERTTLLQEEYDESHPRVSPNGQWLAYMSNEFDEYEVFVRPFPDVNKGKWQVSTNGGREPRWSQDGQKLYYRNGDSIMVVSVDTNTTFSFEPPKIFLQGIRENYFLDFTTYWDIDRNGRRILMIEESSADLSTGEIAQPKINFISNWFEELKERVPTD